MPLLSSLHQEEHRHPSEHWLELAPAIQACPQCYSWGSSLWAPPSLYSKVLGYFGVLPLNCNGILSVLDHLYTAVIPKTVSPGDICDPLSLCTYTLWHLHNDKISQQCSSQMGHFIKCHMTMYTELCVSADNRADSLSPRAQQ